MLASTSTGLDYFVEWEDEDVQGSKHRAYYPVGVGRQLVAILAPSVERLTLTLKNKTLVRYGPAENLRAKNAALVAVLRRLRREGRQVAYIDVRAPASPAVATHLTPVVPVAPSPAASASPSPAASPSASPSPH